MPITQSQPARLRLRLAMGECTAAPLRDLALSPISKALVILWLASSKNSGDPTKAAIHARCSIRQIGLFAAIGASAAFGVLRWFVQLRAAQGRRLQDDRHAAVRPAEGDIRCNCKHSRGCRSMRGLLLLKHNFMFSTASAFERRS